MVEPDTTPDITFTVSGERLARAEVAHERFAMAVHGLAHEVTLHTSRTAAQAERDLAAACRELGREFIDITALFSALHYRADELDSRADDHERRSVRLEAHASRGDAA